MAEISKVVTPTQVTYNCDVCGPSPVLLLKETFSGTPYIYLYICPNCQATVTSAVVYPYYTYK